MSRSDKEPLLDFIRGALEARNCTLVHTSEPSHAPFYVVFDTPGGSRQGLLIYAFFANSKITKKRPDDEHRFQIKYGGNLRGILEVALDPSHLVTTLFLGIDPVEKIFVAADPLMNTPSPMSRSIEFKPSTSNLSGATAGRYGSVTADQGRQRRARQPPSKIAAPKF